MDDSTHVEPPVPSEGSEPAELVGRAGDLWRWAGQPTEDTLRSLMGTRLGADGAVTDALPAGTLQSVLDGQADLPWDAVAPFVVACLRSGRRTQEQISLDLTTWRTAWTVIEKARAASGKDGAADRADGGPEPAGTGGSVADALAGPPSGATPAANTGTPTGGTPAVGTAPGDGVDSEAPTIVHRRPPIRSTAVQPAVPPPPVMPPPVMPPPPAYAPPPAYPPQESLGDALFGAFAESSPPPPPPPPPTPSPVDDPWAPVPPAGRGRSRLPVLAAAAVGVIALVAGGVAVAATRGGGHGQGHSSASQSTPAAEETGVDTTLPTGMALPAEGTSATPTSASPTATTAPPTTQSAPATTTASVPTSQPTPAAPPPATTTVRASTAAPPPTTTSAPKTTAPANSPTLCTTGDCAGSAYFVSYGEHLHVCDNIRDGYAAVAQYTRSDVAGNNVARDDNGAGTCVDHNMDMPEGAKITFRVCLGRSDGSLFNCSGYYTMAA